MGLIHTQLCSTTVAHLSLSPSLSLLLRCKTTTLKIVFSFSLSCARAHTHTHIETNGFMSRKCKNSEMAPTHFGAGETCYHHPQTWHQYTVTEEMLSPSADSSGRDVLLPSTDATPIIDMTPIIDSNRRDARYRYHQTVPGETRYYHPQT